MAHAMAPDTSPQPLLTALGACVPVRGLYVLDTAFDAPGSYTDWLDEAPLVFHRSGFGGSPADP